MAGVAESLTVHVTLKLHCSFKLATKVTCRQRQFFN